MPIDTLRTFCGLADTEGSSPFLLFEPYLVTFIIPKVDTKVDTEMKRARIYGLCGVQEKGLEPNCKMPTKPRG